ncbi:hypothetical protein [Acidaminobacterium chupaoyuni]
MKIEVLLADISRGFLKDRHIFRYGMKKVSAMSDSEVIRCCHFYCEENKQTHIFEEFRKRVESEYRYCEYLSEYIEDGLCYDIQMICAGYIKRSALGTYIIDDAAMECCAKCRYKSPKIIL